MPQCIHELCNLSILNISGNVEITELPANMGLLFRLWNLNTKGCSLSGRIVEMIESKKYKTMEIIGYLKSIYEDAKPYARMKLMVVGSQKIGKTSILQLLHELYPSQNKQLSSDHWTKRMGTAAGPGPGKKGKEYNISTVGVDIGTWVCEERRNGSAIYGPVTFRTWDFGGQQEYYATHQYFLSKRSLYLVVWRIDEGKNGLVEVLQWLANIQARAPNSPVIIVGTHYDKVDDTITKKKVICLQKYIKERFIAVGDSEKMGLPKVITSIEISCT